MKRILILYRELAGYFIQCVHHLCEHHQVEAEIIAYPVNADAPFQFTDSPLIKIHNRSDFNQQQLDELVANGNFNLIFCGGWSDKEYLVAIKNKACTSLLGFDNQWNGSLMHRLSSLYGKWKIKPLFDVAFVPGEKQAAFARHLGFDNAHIIKGAYSCDVERFSALQNTRVNRDGTTKKKLLYVGRYAPEKFVTPLFSKFSELYNEGFSNWELHGVGIGALWNERLISDGIIHHGFKQPDELFEIMKEGDAFILPSTFEPWGVVVHEFAAAGYPMLLSSHVGAAEKFLVNGENGYIFRSGDAGDMKEKMKILFSADKALFMEMGKRSAALSKQITPATWAKSLYELM